MRSVNEEKTTGAPDDVSALGTMPVERLEREITRQAAHINAATCRWLLVGEFDRRGLGRRGLPILHALALLPLRAEPGGGARAAAGGAAG
jgi:hypothetical protein